MKTNLKLILLFLALTVSVTVSAEEFLIDFGAVYTHSGPWNTIDGASTTYNNLIDNDTEAASGASLTLSGTLDSFGDPSNYSSGDLHWFHEEVCDDMLYYDGGTPQVITISGLVENSYQVEIISLTSLGILSGTYEVNSAYAQRSFNTSPNVNCSFGWDSYNDGYLSTDWMIWDAVVPVGGVITIDAVADGINPLMLINAIRISYNDAPMPVELSSFNALQNESDFAEIQWITQSETEQSGFNILKSESENNDEAVKVNSSIIAAANTASGSEYSFTDVDVDFDNTYYYWLESVSLDNNVKLYGPVSITISRDKGDNVPDAEYTDMISAVYPNPFNPETNIDFSIKTTGNVTLEVYNLKGQRVKTLVDDSVEAGDHSVIWHGDTDSGNSAATGVYFIKLRTNEYQQTKKVMMIK